VIPILGLAGCMVLAFALPLPSVATGVAVVGLGAAVYGVRRLSNRGRTAPPHIH
jgi:APA family basic amino acid/polyamine antiporter